MRTADKLSTYDHDYSLAEAPQRWDSARSSRSGSYSTRSTPRGGGHGHGRDPRINKLSARSTTGAERNGEPSSAREGPEMRQLVADKHRKDYKEGRKNHFQSGGSDTMKRLRELQAQGKG